jgi:amidase
VQQLLDAGAQLAGKTHTEELAFSLTGENAHFGTPINPAAPDRIPGGSSSGSAAATAAGLVDFAIGSDTGGSVRGPASFCGIYGIRPTWGRLSLVGACALAPRFDTVGWFARDADMLTRVGAVLFGVSLLDTHRPTRVLVAADALAAVDDDARAPLEDAVRRVAGALGTVRDITLADKGLSAWYNVFRVLQFRDVHTTHRAWIDAEQPMFGPKIARRFAAVARITDAEVAAAEHANMGIRARLDALLADGAVLVMPTMPNIAPHRDEPEEQTTAFRERAISLLCVSGLGGLPQISVPLAQNGEGLPLGVSLLGARGSDEQLLALARQLMHAR